MNEAPELTHALYCGDNLPVLQTCVADESIDLVYLDPPFYSQRNYQAFFRQISLASSSSARVAAFEDTWRWDADVEQSYRETLARAPAVVAHALVALRELLGPGSLLAYLVMMAARLVELRRVLKSTGSIYLHCDPAASHYLKLLLDVVFGATNFRNEIVWSYKTGGASPRHFARKHDLIFFYSKSDSYLFQSLKEKSYMMHRYGFKKSEFLHDERGDYTWVYMKDVWELPALGAADRQRLGYPTQKPEILLERIIGASSVEGGVVLDPFCGSGTTLAVAQRLGRGWIGIEGHYLGIAYQRYRLARLFPDLDYTFAGGPTTVDEARQLARADTAQFRWWALSRLCARPISGEGLAALEPPGGIVHGLLPGEPGGLPHLCVVASLEGIQLEMLNHLHALVEARKGIDGCVISLDAPGPMVRQALSRFSTPGGSPLVRVITVAELLQ